MPTIKVPGATLYYEVRGSGPVLLLICGGIYDADLFVGVAEALSDDHTVVTYDRRGNSRSALDAAPAPLVVAEHAEDAYYVLKAVGVTADEPADVFGNSSGAIFGMELALHHPSMLRTLIAHEPPVLDILPTREHFLRAADDIERAFAEGGAPAAMPIFGASFATEPGATPQPPRDSGGEAQMSEHMTRNVTTFVGYEVPPVGRYAPDLAALRTSPVRIVFAVGEDSRTEAPARCSLALAAATGTEPLSMPGDHVGFGSQPKAFAAALRPALSPA